MPTFRPAAFLHRFLRGLAALWAFSLVSLPVPSPADPPSAQARNENAPLQIGTLRVSRILYLGNSITWHGAKPSIGWNGNWGMAASSPERDYVHVLTAKIGKAAGGNPQFLARNIADFERGFQSFDLNSQLKEELEFQPDLVIIAIGENVPALTTDELKTEYATAFRNLLTTLKEHGAPTIVVRSTFWSNKDKDHAMQTASKEAGAHYVDISQLGAKPENAASSEREFEHAGVAAHPGDRGMQAIADAIWKVVEDAAREQSSR